MRKSITLPLIVALAFLLIWINLPVMISDRLRSYVSTPFAKRSFENRGNELASLELENRNLRLQIDQAYEWLLFDKKLNDSEFSQKRGAYVKTHLKEQLLSIPAQVIYRDPSLWSSSLWVNVGENTNWALKKKIVMKNSPVLADGAIVGVLCLDERVL